jgi:hypothetical protein
MGMMSPMPIASSSTVKSMTMWGFLKSPLYQYSYGSADYFTADPLRSRVNRLAYLAK